ncbi:reverse transcriptase [Cucumis melo var. makuwa]|uniref:Reverse transcriptase n=1 Tax=Cucumis melo var. makuwa TaxID=1194695 RepID=A0A5A7UCA5_CUCMM|nr:reverse transcriptase [Cucumis melo var. makuwa]
MMEGPLLGIADVTKPFEVETDAFDYALRKGSSNQAANALSRKQEHAAICLLVHLWESEIGGSVRDILREFLQKDHAAQNVMNLVNAGKTRQFWVEEDLLVTKGNRLYRTYALLKKGYFWSNMRDDVMQYTKTCLICQQDKLEKVKVAGLLDPLRVPTRPWESVSMDIITHLPKGVSTIIVSDRDGRFIGSFWTELFSFLETSQNISSSYHPQTDGQTEQFNCMLDEYLRHFVNARQKNWVQLLDVAQFFFNAQTSSSTGRSPFEIVSRRQPVLPHLVDHPFAGKNPQALNFTKKWKQTNNIARAYLEKASKRMKKWADKKRRPLEFRAGDQVLIKLRPEQVGFRGRKDQRLIRKYEGPVEVLKKQNIVTRPIIDLSQKEDKDVEEILAKRVRRGRKPTRRIHEYLVKWKNLYVEETSWERVEDLESWKQKIEDFKLRQLMGTSTI